MLGLYFQHLVHQNKLSREANPFQFTAVKQEVDPDIHHPGYK